MWSGGERALAKRVMESVYATTPKFRVIDVIDYMFRARGYDLSSKSTAFCGENQVWQIFIRGRRNEKVMCILTPVESNDLDSVGVQRMGMDGVRRMDDVGLEPPELLFGDGSVGVENWNGIGTDFMKCMDRYIRDHSIDVVIIISDKITSHASKLLEKTKVDITYFTYSQISNPYRFTHMYQPVVFRGLPPEERLCFIREHPMYRRELARFSNTDPMVMFYGLKVGDIVELSEINSAGETKEYGIIEMETFKL